MLRLSLLAAAFPLVFPVAGLAKSINLTSNYLVESVTATRPDPVVRGRVEGAAGPLYRRVRAESLPGSEDAGPVEVYFGMPPQSRDLATEVSFSRNFEPVGAGGAPGPQRRVGTRFRFDAAGETAETEARAAVEVIRGIQVAGVGAPGFDDAPVGFDLDATRRLAALCRAGLRYGDALEEAALSEISLEF